jgi:stage II sporulation protein GA (sporulation sigma-E factor processing peptidase)
MLICIQSLKQGQQKAGVGVEYRFLDVIWLDNLLVNFVVLWITWKISGNAAPMWRLWCSACVGACYAIMLLMPGFSILSAVLLKILLSLTMLAVGFRISSFSEGLKLLGYFYGATFLMGGAAYGFYYFFNANIQISKGMFLIKDFPIKIIIYSTVFIIMLYRWLWPLLQLRLSHRQLVYKVKIQFGEESLIVDAFLDTGNELIDPISGRPVIVAEFESMKSILPTEIQKIFQKGKEKELDYVTKILSDSTWINRFFIVPFQTLSASNDYLLAFKPDRIEILTDGCWLGTRQSLVGIRNRKLSLDDEYHALIQPHIIP